MPTDDHTFSANSDSCYAIVRAIAQTLDEQDPTVDLVARALFSELGGMSSQVGAENALFAPASITPKQLLAYQCVGNSIDSTGYSNNIISQIMKDLAALQAVVRPEPSGDRPTIRENRAKFALFDIVEMFEMDGTDASASPQWLVRSGQWAYWLLTAEARELYSRISRAALATEEYDTFKLTARLGEFVRFQLRSHADKSDTQVPLLNVLAEICDATFLSARQKKDEARIAEELRHFERASAALAAQGVCSISISAHSSPHAAVLPADNDNEAMLHSSVVTISDVA